MFENAPLDEDTVRHGLDLLFLLHEEFKNVTTVLCITHCSVQTINKVVFTHCVIFRKTKLTISPKSNFPIFKPNSSRIRNTPLEAEFSFSYKITNLTHVTLLGPSVWGEMENTCHLIK